MERIRKRFNNTSLKHKLLSIILMSAAIILACSLCGSYLCTMLYNELLFKTIAGNLAVSSYSISEKLRNIETLSSSIISDPTVQEQLTALRESDDAIVRSNANRRLNAILLSHYESFKSNGLAYIALYNDTFSNCTNWALLSKTDPEMVRTARNNAAPGSGAVTWNYRGRDDYMLLTRNVLEINNLTFSHLGSLMIALDLDKAVTDSNRAVTLYDGSRYIITDKDNLILYASDSLSDGDAAYFMDHSVRPYQLLSANGHTYFSVIGTLPHYEYRYVSLIPFDSIETSLKLAMGLMVFGLFLGFVLVVFLSRGLVCYIVKQFNSLILKMQTFREDKLPPTIVEDEYSLRQDELGKLHQQFDQMADRIQTLVKVNYVNELLTKDARLKALESQINPHFLYNTLESINSMAKMNGNTAITQMVSALGNLLRSNLSHHESLVPLSYELELVESYMTIQKIRFEDRLIYEIHASPSLMDISIPPLTIQPLVENAIHYGMEEMTDECHIIVDTFLDGGLAVIQVKNEGSYFEPGLLEKLANRETKPNGFGIGLLNINQRIQILFGDAYGLSLCNQDSYAVASITLPYRPKPPEGGEEIPNTAAGGERHVQTDNCG